MRCSSAFSLAVLASLAAAAYGQSIQPIPLKNWAVAERSRQEPRAQSVTADSGLIFIAITPCRVVDTRYPGGAFGTPSLVANTPRIFPVPASNCGVPVAAAYSMNFVSITPAGQAVGFVGAWQDDHPWPGTVVLNAVQGGIVDNAAIVPAGADGGIQVMASGNCDLVIDMNGYYVQTGNLQGPPGPQGLQGPPGPTGAQGPQGLTGPKDLRDRQG
jgi:hypothetical protein